jgi:hypothetical protein
MYLHSIAHWQTAPGRRIEGRCKYRCKLQLHCWNYA